MFRFKETPTRNDPTSRWGVDLKCCSENLCARGLELLLALADLDGPTIAGAARPWTQPPSTSFTSERRSSSRAFAS
jgi:hypothetical protein